MAKEDSAQKVLEAAILSAKGLDQKTIALTQGVSQPAVSRRLKQARALGYLEDPPPPYPRLRVSHIPEVLLNQAQDALFFNELSKKLRRGLNELAGLDLVRNVSVVRTPVQPRDAEFESWRARLRVVVQSAAGDVPELLSRATKVGVAWGHTLRYLVDELRDLTAHRDPPIIFPIVGSFPHSEDPYPIDSTSTKIAMDLAEKLSGRIPPNQVSLEAVPAFIPAGLEREAIERYFSTLPGFREVFGGPGKRNAKLYPNALMNSVDFIITGLGALPTKDVGEGSPTLKERLKHEDSDLETWARISVGDIGGVLLPRNAIADSDVDKVIGDSGINRRFIGIGLEDLQACSKLCVESKGETPGVLVIAHDKLKAPTVVEAVRYRCVNHLYIDKDLADAIIEILPA